MRYDVTVSNGVNLCHPNSHANSGTNCVSIWLRETNSYLYSTINLGLPQDLNQRLYYLYNASMAEELITGKNMYIRDFEIMGFR